MSRIAHTLVVCLVAALTVVATPTVAAAGGYDTPMLYSARHLGMGGTAVASVDDPSALFHNPAGLSGTDQLTLLGDFSLLVGNIDGAPNADIGSITSETTVAPFFLVGASGRITEWLTVGFAAYPVASAGGEYRYNEAADGSGRDITDRTRLVFMELSPGVAFEVPQLNLSFGFGYRITLVNLERSRRDEDGELAFRDLDFEISGTNVKGLRFGLQWAPMVRGERGSELGLSFGAHYRHKTTTTISGNDQYAIADVAELESSFTLPSRMSFGVRADYAEFSAAFDLEYSFNSQNDVSSFDVGLTVDNVFDWSDSVTTRVGLEYRLLDEQLPLRVGYVWDQQTANTNYPTAFGTPPAATHVITVGAGYDTGPLSVNFAFAHRRGGATFTDEQLAARDRSCAFCGFPGEYFIRLNGIYLDVSYAWGRGEIGDTPAEVRARNDAPAAEDEPPLTESE